MSPDIEITGDGVYFTGNPYTVTRERPESIIHLFIALAENNSAPDASTLSACVTNAPLLAEIERSRVHAALRTLLAVKNPAPVLALMHKRGILKYGFGFPLSDFSPLTVLQDIESMVKEISPWQTRLILLLLSAPMPPEDALKHLDTYWGVHPDESTYLKDLLDFFPAADPAMPKAKKAALIEKYDGDFVKSLFSLRWALEDDVKTAKQPYLKALA